MEAKYLICTEADANHNKYYKMIPDQNGISFTVEYGRIGAKPMKRSYPASRFHVLYNEKLQKGYVDQTALHENVSDAVKGKFKKIEDSSVDWLINTLMAYANKVIDQNYTVKIEEVTPEMVNTASELLDDLSKRGFVISTSEFNRKLLKLFQVIPRKMKNVEDHLAASSLDYEEILEREYDILDVMHSQVASTGKLNLEHTENKNEKTILDVLGLTIRPCTPEENKKICEKLTDESKGKFARAWYISNKKTDDRYNLYCQKHRIGKRDGKAELSAFFLKVFGYSGVYEEDESDMSCRSKAVKCDRYEVGDKVLIRKWDDMAKQYGFNNYGSIECREKFCQEMKAFCGKVFVISNVDRKHNTYLLKNGDDWTFSTDMFVGKID